jgi:hypothetical protein
MATPNDRPDDRSNDRSDRDGTAVGRADMLRALGVAAIAVVGLVLFARIVHRHYPIQDWFAWRWFLLAGYTLAFQAACVSIGSRLLPRVLGERKLPLLETWLAAMGLGLVAFVFAMYLVGAVGLFVTPVAIALPTIAIAIGRRSIGSLIRRSVAELADRPSGSPWSRFGLAIGTATGILGVAVIYAIGFSPDAISFDAQWYHLPIAQDYARHGRIVAFPGDYNRSFPHLASLVYTWGYLLPGLSTPLKWMMALHLEFAMVVWKLVGIAALAQWMLGDHTRRGLWLGLFLFPAIFAFGNTVGGGAEHFLAFWAAPMLTSTARMLEDDFDPRHAALLGIFAGGATLTKYQAIYMVVACGTVIAARWIVLMLVHQRARAHRTGAPTTPMRNLWVAPVVIIAATMQVAAPHFVKNLVFYANPLYPFAQDAFGGTPTHPLAGELWRTMLGEEGNHPKAHGLSRLPWTLEIAATFSFVPHYTVGWVKEWPLFGSLFTLLAPCALLIRRSRRIWIGLWCGFVVLAIWGNTYLTDRYLNAAVPVFAAVTVALLVRVWDLGQIARLAVAPLVAFQLIWSADAAMYSGEKLIRSTMEIWSSGWRDKATDAERFDQFATFRKITEATPPDAKILLRGSRPSLGLDRDVWLDLQWGQAALFYQPLEDAHDLWALYRERGITHLVWKTDVHYSGTLQSSVLFAELVTACAGERRRFGAYELMALCDEQPPRSSPLRVLVRKQTVYADGLYYVEDLHAFGRHSPTEREHVPPRTAVDFRKADQVRTALRRSDVVLLGKSPGLPKAIDTELKAEFDRFEALDTLEVWLRKSTADRGGAP